jgi:hypothetical protein
MPATPPTTELVARRLEQHRGAAAGLRLVDLEIRDQQIDQFLHP